MNHEKGPEGAGGKGGANKEKMEVKCSVALTEPLARKLMKSKARPLMHQALLRHLELSHVALPEHGNVVLGDVWDQTDDGKQSGEGKTSAKKAR